MKEQKTSEKLIYRKGVRLQVVLEYFFLFFLCKSFLYLIEQSEIMKETSIFQLFQISFLHDIFILGVIAIFIHNVVENIVLNATLLDIENNKIWKFTLSFVSSFLALLISMICFHVEISLQGSIILLISTLIALIHTKICIGYFSLSGFILLSVIHYIVDRFQYGISFNGNSAIIIAFSLAVFLINAMLHSILKNFIQKRVVKSVFQTDKKLRLFLYPFLTVFMLPLSYGVSMLIAQLSGWIKIISYMEVIWVYLFYFLLASQFNLILSSMKTKKQTYTSQFIVG